MIERQRGKGREGAKREVIQMPFLSLSCAREDCHINCKLTKKRILFFRQTPQADNFTRKFYASKGIDLGPDIDIERPSSIRFERQIPPYNGFGSEEDSLSSCTGSIKPAPAKKEFHYDKRGHVTRFNAMMLSQKVEDKNRR